MRISLLYLSFLLSSLVGIEHFTGCPLSGIALWLVCGEVLSVISGFESKQTPIDRKMKFISAIFFLLCQNRQSTCAISSDVFQKISDQTPFRDFFHFYCA
jgi:hypothetical protein